MNDLIIASALLINRDDEDRSEEETSEDLVDPDKTADPDEEDGGGMDMEVDS